MKPLCCHECLSSFFYSLEVSEDRVTPEWLKNTWIVFYTAIHSEKKKKKEKEESIPNRNRRIQGVFFLGGWLINHYYYFWWWGRGEMSREWIVTPARDLPCSCLLNSAHMVYPTIFFSYFLKTVTVRFTCAFLTESGWEEGHGLHGSYFFLLPKEQPVKKAEYQRIDAFELWCWRRFLRVPWTARRSSQSILKEISLGCSLEELMLKLKLQYFGHLM